MCAKWSKSFVSFLIICLFTGMLSAKTNQNPGIGLGLHGGALNFIGDVTPKDFGYLGEASVEVPLSRNFSAMLVGGFGQQKFGPADALLSTQLATFDVRGAFRLPVTSFLWPMIYVGAGAINFQRGDWPRYWDGMGIAGAGFELKLGKRLGLSLCADYRYTSGDDFDGVAEGSTDPYVTAKAGVHYHFPAEEKEEEPPLAAETLKLGQRKGTDEEFLTELIAADAKGASDATVTAKIAAGSDSEMFNRIQMLNEIIAEREAAIAQMKAELQATDQRIASLEMELRGKTTVYQDYGQFADFQNQYQIGIQKFNDKVFGEAASIFEALIEAEPTNKLAGNCQYWIGECEYASQNYDQAIEAFERTLQYTNSPKADDAMIMLGLAYKRLSQNELAQQYFQRLLDEYPDSEYATRAMRYLGLN